MSARRRPIPTRTLRRACAGVMLAGLSLVVVVVLITEASADDHTLITYERSWAVLGLFACYVVGQLLPRSRPRRRE